MLVSVLLMLGILPATASPAHADTSPSSVAGSSTTIDVDLPAWIAHAPAKKVKGGIKGASVSCSDGAEIDYYRVQVKKGSKTIGTRTSTSDEVSWIRVKPAKYKVITTVKCGDVAKVITKKVKIRTLKDSETISRKEYKRLKIGMKTKQVKKITGIRGSLKYCEDECVFNTTVWNRLAGISIWDGKLVQKGWGTQEDF